MHTNLKSPTYHRPPANHCNKNKTKCKMSVSGASNTKTGTSAEQNKNEEKLEDAWAIRPCFLYKEEYDDCTSMKARFHQYFIHGESIDCTQWKRDYENCVKYHEDKIREAGLAVIKSEENRRRERLKAHFANNVWKRRSSPPEDWSKPLPEWLQKKNENTFLEIKSKELNDPNLVATEEKSYCVIM